MLKIRAVTDYLSFIICAWCLCPIECITKFIMPVTEGLSRTDPACSPHSPCCMLSTLRHTFQSGGTLDSKTTRVDATNIRD